MLRKNTVNTTKFAWNVGLGWGYHIYILQVYIYITSIYIYYKYIYIIHIIIEPISYHSFDIFRTLGMAPALLALDAQSSCCVLWLCVVAVWCEGLMRIDETCWSSVTILVISITLDNHIDNYKFLDNWYLYIAIDK